ncbi:MAG: FecR domain-containing protein [Myxococcota bacterium]
MMSTRERSLPRTLDAKLTEGPIPPGSKQRTLARIRGGARPPHVQARGSAWAALGVAAGATVVSLLWWARATPESSSAEPTIAARPRPCATPDETGHLQIGGGCTVTLDDPKLTIASWGQSMLRTSPGPLVFESGWVVFDVEPVNEGPPVRIELRSATLEVLGTRFSVYQDDVRGHVELVEGRLRVIEHSGHELILEPGDRHAWTNAPPLPEPDLTPPPITAPSSLPAKPARTPSASPPGPRKTARAAAPVQPAPQPAPTLPEQRSTSLEEIGRLRARGRYRDAVKLIDTLLAAKPGHHASMVLHYEAGTILQDALVDADAACEHFQTHRKRFPNGQYDADVIRRLKRLGCVNNGPTRRSSHR